jgi:hypothetical protein
MRRWAVRLALVAAGAAVVVGAVHYSTRSDKGSPAQARSFAAAAGVLPQPQRPAFRVGRPSLLNRYETVARFAAVKRAIAVRSAPGPTAPSIAALGLKTPEATTNIVLAIGERVEPDGLWVHVRLPVLPNDRTGWVPRGALGGYQFVHTHLVVDRERFTATLLDDGRPIFTAPVGVGEPQSPTPAGDFYIRDRLSGFGNPFYGPVAFGTSARSAVLTDWPAGGFIGLHGTNEPGLIPGRISHGCIRMRNADILRLRRLMPVGTPVTIR